MIYFILFINAINTVLNEEIINRLNKAQNIKVIDYAIVDSMISTKISIGSSSSRYVPIDLCIDASFISSKFLNVEKMLSSGIDSILYNSITYIMTSYKNSISFHSDNENKINIDNFFFYNSEYGYVDHELLSLSYKSKYNEKSIMYNLKKSDMINKESFTIIPSVRSKGHIIFGDISYLLNEYNKAVLSIENTTTSQWNTKLNEVSLSMMNGTVISLTNNSNIYFKSDSNDILIPTDAFNVLTKFFFSNRNFDCSVYGGKYLNVLRCQCDIQSNFKSISLKIGEYQFEINDLFTENQGKCDFIMKNKFGELNWGIGYVFFDKFITTFDKEDNEIVLYSKNTFNVNKSKDTFMIKNMIEINSLLLFVMIIVHSGYKYIL